jgi:hypothetical protein
VSLLAGPFCWYRPCALEGRWREPPRESSGNPERAVWHYTDIHCQTVGAAPAFLHHPRHGRLLPAASDPVGGPSMEPRRGLYCGIDHSRGETADQARVPAAGARIGSPGELATWTPIEVTSRATDPGDTSLPKWQEQTCLRRPLRPHAESPAFSVDWELLGLV